MAFALPLLLALDESNVYTKWRRSAFSPSALSYHDYGPPYSFLPTSFDFTERLHARSKRLVVCYLQNRNNLPHGKFTLPSTYVGHARRHHDPLPSAVRSVLYPNCSLENVIKHLEHASLSLCHSLHRIESPVILALASESERRLSLSSPSVEDGSNCSSEDIGSWIMAVLPPSLRRK